MLKNERPNELREQRQEIQRLQQIVKQQKQKTYPSSLVSSCPPASAVDDKLIGLYLSFFSGLYGDLATADNAKAEDVQTGYELLLDEAHHHAMRLVKRVRKELLHDGGTGQDDDTATA